jgi:hypothetical protein
MTYTKKKKQQKKQKTKKKQQLPSPATGLKEDGFPRGTSFMFTQ